MKTLTSALERLPAAEQHLIAAVNAATNAIESVAADNLDAALARLEDATRACHARLGIAMGTLRNTVAEIAETMEAIAEGIIDDLNAGEPATERDLAYTTLTTEQQPDPAPIVTATTKPEPDAPGCDDDGITFTEEEFAALRKRQSAASNSDHAQEAPKMPRQAPQASETAREPSEAPIQTPKGSFAAGETVLVAAIAANPPVDAPDRDDRKPTPTTSTKSRRRRKAS